MIDHRVRDPFCLGSIEARAFIEPIPHIFKDQARGLAVQVNTWKSKQFILVKARIRKRYQRLVRASIVPAQSCAGWSRGSELLKNTRTIKYDGIAVFITRRLSAIVDYGEEVCGRQLI